MVVTGKTDIQQNFKNLGREKKTLNTHTFLHGDDHVHWKTLTTKNYTQISKYTNHTRNKVEC
jgi:hypothetical protein